jgi:hypothetical protein
MTVQTIPPEADAAELKRFGILAVTTEQFLVGPYRYTERADALAEAKRHPPAGNDA